MVETLDVFPLDGFTGNGIIVQNITIDIKYWDCKTGKENSTHDSYAEAWSIGHDDTWSLAFNDEARGECGTYGIGVWYGIANYYDSLSLSYVPPYDGWTIDPAGGHPWGSFHGMQGFVSYPGLNPTGYGLKRKMTIGWNCCNGDSPTESSYLAISTTLISP